MISRKILVAEKSLNFHTVVPESHCNKDPVGSGVVPFLDSFNCHNFVMNDFCIGENHSIIFFVITLSNVFMNLEEW